MDKSKIQNTTLTETEIQEIAEMQSAPFVLLIKHSGFVRTPGSVTEGMAQGIVTGILTLGSFYTVPIHANSRMEYCVIDKTSRKIVLYSHNAVEFDPRNEDTLKEHINYLVKDLNSLQIN
jgi:hypothetical protein